MTFAAPLFLLAALAGLIPVVLHLIHRRKAREVRFSTLRFLRISVQRTRRRKYVEDLSLLIVRVAVLLLIAAGPGPARALEPGLALGGGRPAAIAIVLDNSASMAVTDDGRPRFETARQGAEQVLGQTARGRPRGPAADRRARPAPSSAGSSAPTRPCGRPSTSAGPAIERADLAARIQQARGLLDRAEAPSKEIYVFTDNQALSWEGLKEPQPER